MSGLQKMIEYGTNLHQPNYEPEYLQIAYGCDSLITLSCQYTESLLSSTYRGKQMLLGGPGQQIGGRGEAT